MLRIGETAKNIVGMGGADSREAIHSLLALGYPSRD
jgi:hypothetical protein